MSLNVCKQRIDRSLMQRLIITPIFVSPKIRSHGKSSTGTRRELLWRKIMISISLYTFFSMQYIEKQSHWVFFCYYLHKKIRFKLIQLVTFVPWKLLWRLSCFLSFTVLIMQLIKVLARQSVICRYILG